MVPWKGLCQADQQLLHILCLHSTSTAPFFLQINGSSCQGGCKNGHWTFASAPYQGLDECKRSRTLGKLGNSQAISKSTTLGKESEVTISSDWIVLSKQWMPSINACLAICKSKQPVDSVDPCSNVLPDEISWSTHVHEKKLLAEHLLPCPLL